MRTAGCLLFVSLALACVGRPPAVEPADLVVLGDHILTVDLDTAGATGVAVRGDTIVAVGSREEASRYIGDATRVVELGERALVPGFIDTHGHLAMMMMFIDMVNVSSPPVGPAQSVEDVVEILTEALEEAPLDEGDWLLGFGYDDSLLAEGRHPTRDDLDRVSTDQPVALLHVSGHLATANSAALAAAGFDATTGDPQGGVIRRRANSREPNGVLEETAAHILFGVMASDDDPAAFASRVQRTLDLNASHGITTLQDGASNLRFIAGVRALAAQQPLIIDVAAFPAVNMAHQEHATGEVGFTREYTNGLRVAGVKFVLDGSPQGRTAWLSEPYDEGPPGAPADYVAYPIMNPDAYRAQVAPFIESGIPILVHANGDAAIDLMMDGVEAAIGDTRPDHRSVIIHAQVTRPDQLPRMKDLGVVPSYFAAHQFFWGDWHRISFGDARASHTSPLRSTLELGIPFTIHNDAPVVPPHVMRLLEIAVERRTRNGHVLGPDQRLTVEQALYAVTQGGAYQYFEEDQKGSITPGKRADLVILARDPRAVPADEISEIEVLETVARGRSVFTLGP